MIREDELVKCDRNTKQQLFSCFVCVVRLVLGCLLLHGSLSEIRHPYDVLANVYSYELVGPKLGMLIVMVLPWLELLAGICLIGGICMGGALLISMAMIVVFMFAISLALYHDLAIHCRVFGFGTGVIGYSSLIQLGMIFLVSIVAYLGIILPKPLIEGKEGIANRSKNRGNSSPICSTAAEK